MDRIAIFSGLLLPDYFNRHQDWITYYGEYFNGDPVDVFLFNNGLHDPSRDDLKIPTGASVQVVDCGERLPRPDFNIFPGWKRSFGRGLWLLRGLGYTKIGWIESDCYLVESAHDKFIELLGHDRYFTGFTERYRFPDTSIQAMSKIATDIFINKYEDSASWSENVQFESMVSEELHPDTSQLIGERFESDQSFVLRPDYDYVAQVDFDSFSAMVT